MAMEEFAQESKYAHACQKAAFATRMQEAGLGELVKPGGGPRHRCKVLAAVGEVKETLLAEGSQRLMLTAISDSIPAYCSGIRCWAAFCDAMGCSVHFPASEEPIMSFGSIFSTAQTYIQYVNHLRWAHRFLRMDCAWDTDAVKQVRRGAAKTPFIKLPKIAVNSRQVSNLVKAAMASDESAVAALMAVARQFLLRVPSEGIPLQWDGSHSNVALEPTRASITLYKR